MEHRRLPAPSDLDEGAALIETFGSIRSAFHVIRRATGHERWADVETGRRTQNERRFEAHLDELQPLIDFVGERGRLPRTGELTNEATLRGLFGSIRAAFSVVRRVTGPERWEDVERSAGDDFLVYVALSAFSGRPNFGSLPVELQFDAKDLFGSYKAACQAADELLYSIADLSSLDRACRAAPFGKMTPEALYVHVDGIPHLPPVLRVYVGAAQSIRGDVTDATIVKLHRLKPQISFLMYPTFDRDPHPPLRGSLIGRLPELRVDYRDGIVVDDRLRTSEADVWAAGDVARYPGPEGVGVRVEHWVLAERQGQVAAANMLGNDVPFTDPPFFWSQHYDVPINVTGHLTGWEEEVVVGDPYQRDVIIGYRKGDAIRAVASIYRDRESLIAEHALARDDQGAIRDLLGAASPG